MKIRSMNQINFKCPAGLIEFMDCDIEVYGDHRNRSEYIVAALREYETKRVELKSQIRNVIDRI